MGQPPGYRVRQELMDADRVSRTLARMAHEVMERHPQAGATVLVGVQTRGVPLARRLAAIIKHARGTAPAVGSLDITLYRDDLTTIAAHPVLKGTQIPVSIDGRAVVLVDDVLFTGRTARAALDELIDFGRPARIALAVLVDRGHRELPIRADYVGKAVTTARAEIVQVMLREEDGEDRVLLLEPAEAAPARPPARARKAKGGRRK
ncbi:MAG TPA: bifunctional pyr operon transcriptional regulator/uracil phosphoribosyltransferase PyrR [Vicinamibacteria bacterium]|jgi:pyrimidine operon attenuation protein/uracil phosphoribosyltransferase